MAIARLPDDEPDRLLTLHSYGILDTPPDRRFDRLAHLAARHNGVPIALVCLVDEHRQWFKAAVGLDVSETARDAAFCAHAILVPEQVMVVEDATRDARFCGNPLVTGEPGIRFYAGAPIAAENGQPLGTVCIIDRKPRTLKPDERLGLADLAATAGSMLELHRKSRILTNAATCDPLTGVANRRALDTAVAEALGAALDGRPRGLICLDLDDFATINDRFGHDAGDLLLREVAQRLRASVRAGDLVARQGGDEFAVVTGGPVDLQELRRIGARILAGVAAPVQVAGNVVAIGCSVGVALAPVHGRTVAELLRVGDQALYAAKRAGRHRIVVATTPAAHRARGRGSLMEQDLRRTIAADALDVHWQPQFDARTGALVGCEALARWQRPGLAPVSPAIFVPLAERTGLIRPLDMGMLRAACRAASRWPAPITASVNMSPRWFVPGTLARLVAETLEATGLAPERLMLELTERTLLEHTEEARQSISGLRRMGVRVALDDFGTGFSSLAYLARFDFDEVKLDRGFVADLDPGTRAEQIACATVALAHSLGMRVCAEGVETETQLRLVMSAGCDAVQGFLTGRPEVSPKLIDSATIAGFASTVSNSCRYEP